jgi:hypothetical protein
VILKLCDKNPYQLYLLVTGSWSRSISANIGTASRASILKHRPHELSDAVLLNIIDVKTVKITEGTRWILQTFTTYFDDNRKRNATAKKGDAWDQKHPHHASQIASHASQSNTRIPKTLAHSCAGVTQ